jgi:hypothetical protein
MTQEFDRAGAMQSLLLRYTHALITQMAQTAACNRHHSVEQQLCRWLLMTLDRAPSGGLIVTQELIASMIGAPGRRHRRRRKTAARRIHPLSPRSH